MRYLIVLLFSVFAVVVYAQNKKPNDSAIGRFAIVAAADGGTAWRLDTVTGGLMYCVTAMTTRGQVGQPGQVLREESCTPLR